MESLSKVAKSVNLNEIKKKIGTMAGSFQKLIQEKGLM
jgi:hypothetical protein